MEMRLGPLLAGILLVTSLGAGCLDSSGGSAGGQSEASSQDGNQKPSSFFTFDCHHLECTFDGTRSHDADGQIVSYDWDFGDGTSGQGAIADHTFATEGEYQVTLKVRDSGGGQDSSHRDVRVQAAPAGHGHGGDDPDQQSLPDDYHARHEGPLTPTFEGNWSFPVNDSDVALIHVGFNVTSETLPTALAENVTVNLTDPAGNVVRNATVDTQNPEVRWNVTDGAGFPGTWTVRAQGHGAGDEEVDDGTRYVLVVDVYYGSAP